MKPIELDQLYNPSIMSASIEWFGKTDLDSLCKTIELFNEGRRQKDVKLLSKY